MAPTKLEKNPIGKLEKNPIVKGETKWKPAQSNFCNT